MSSLSRFVACFCLPLCLASLVVGGPARAEISKADEIRLAYLLNFSRYVTWNSGPDRTVFQLCVAENENLAQRLRLATEGKEIDGRKAQALLISGAEQINSCDVLYIPGDVKSTSLEKYLQTAGKLPTLTVGDDLQFLERGGAIRFVVLEGTVRFEIHLDHVRSAGLDMSSRLLKHAERVIEENKKHDKGAQ